MTKSILEAGELKDVGDHYECGAVSLAIGRPGHATGPLMARLDRFMPVKEIAQIGAAIGREFSYELIGAGRADATRPNSTTPFAVWAMRTGFPSRHAARRVYTSSTRSFRTPLTHLLRRRREELHARIATVLETDFAERVAAEPELLARHFTEAGLLEKAVPHWQRAGERATVRSANREGHRTSEARH